MNSETIPAIPDKSIYHVSTVDMADDTFDGDEYEWVSLGEAIRNAIELASTDKSRTVYAVWYYVDHYCRDMEIVGYWQYGGVWGNTKV